MAVQISIQVNADARHTLECGYKTLLSMKNFHHKEVRSYISNNLLFANVHWRRGILAYHCLLTVEPVATNSSSMTISFAGNYDHATDGGDHIETISDFLERFEENLNIL